MLKPILLFHLKSVLLLCWLSVSVLLLACRRWRSCYHQHVKHWCQHKTGSSKLKSNWQSTVQKVDLFLFCCYNLMLSLSHMIKHLKAKSMHGWMGCTQWYCWCIVAFSAIHISLLADVPIQNIVILKQANTIFCFCRTSQYNILLIQASQ